jgi:hypothetical protein
MGVGTGVTAALRYPLAVSAIQACPFCRQLFPQGEAKECPECAVGLVAMDKLPPSHDALLNEAMEGEVTPPEHRDLGAHYFGRGRGALLALAVLGLFAFFLPWVELRAPEQIVVSGFDLARHRAGWLWGGAVGWFTMIPLVWTRRTIFKMRGVRIICVLFALLTFAEVAMMMALPPQSSRMRPVDLSWGWGIYLSGAVSIVAALVASRFGGRVDAISATPWQGPDGRKHTESSDGETLH